MASRKNTKAIPFQWKTILCDATGYYSNSSKCFVVEIHTRNPAGGRPLESQHKTTLKGREEIADFLASEESISVKESLYGKYAEQQVKTFPGETVQRSAENAYTLLEATGEFQRYLVREIGKDRKNPANTKDTLDRDLLEKYLRSYGDRPLCKIDKGVRKTVEQDLAAQDPRYTKHQMQRCRHRLELMQWYVADHGWMDMPKQQGRKRYDAQGQKRHRLANQSLSHEQFSKLLELAKQDALQDGRAVGVLLMLLEGLSPKEVCRLQYEDFVQLPDSVYYSLRVLRPYVEEDGSVMQFGKEKVYPYRLRYVPVCQPLEDIECIACRSPATKISSVLQTNCIKPSNRIGRWCFIICAIADCAAERMVYPGSTGSVRWARYSMMDFTIWWGSRKTIPGSWSVTGWTVCSSWKLPRCLGH